MAVLLVRGGASRGKVISNTCRELLVLDDEAVETLESCARLDRYGDCAWEGDRLRELMASLLELCTQRRRKVEESILAETRQLALREWLVPLVEARLQSSASYRIAQRVLEMARMAERTGSTLLFEGD